MHKFKAISIDDEEVNLLILEELAKNAGLEIQSFTDPYTAADYVKSSEVDLVFVDYLMPGIDGIEMIKIIRRHHPDVPIVMITALGDRRDIKLKAISEGATDFLAKPLDAAEFIARTRNLILLREAQLLQIDRARILQDEVREATKNLVDREYETLSVLGRAAEYKDTETGHHITRVANTSRMIAASMGLSADDQELIFYASPLHDIGKIGIPDSILLKPGALTPEEIKVIKTHTFIGYNILKNTRSKFLHSGGQIAYSHHERFAGGGYPLGLKGDDIPLFGRITAVADAYDAMISKRPYKEAWPHDRAAANISADRGSHFDPHVVDIFNDITPQIIDLYERAKD